MSMPELPLLKFDTVHPVYTGSKALSPFHECYANKDTILRLAAGRFFAHYFTDPHPVVSRKVPNLKFILLIRTQ